MGKAYISEGQQSGELLEREREYTDNRHRQGIGSGGVSSWRTAGGEAIQT